jgi:hypothetical protein
VNRREFITLLGGAVAAADVELPWRRGSSKSGRTAMGGPAAANSTSDAVQHSTALSDKRLAAAWRSSVEFTPQGSGGRGANAIACSPCRLL